MNRLIKKLFLIFIMVSVIFPISINALSKPSEINGYKKYDYVIDSYNIDIKVNENNTYDITETIEVYFNVIKHGIFRTIPILNTVTRLDGTTEKNIAKLSNLKINQKYTTTRENGNYIIKIGSSDTLITGKNIYTISYDYNIGKDKIKDYDELYFNIIGDEWDTVIGNITFRITMPKEFDERKLGFSSGRYGSTLNNVNYSVDGNVIVGSYDGVLKPREALTIRLELDEGYYIIDYNINFQALLFIIIPIIFTLIAYFLWYRFGKDDLVVETVEFYPPEKLNSLEIGYMYKGYATNEDVISLLIYLANKGYIKISDKKIEFDEKKINLNNESIEKANAKIIELEKEIEQEKLNNPQSSKIKVLENLLDVYKNIDKPVDYELSSFEKILLEDDDKSFIIEKIKDYDGNDINEKYFFEGLFENGKTKVTFKDLYNNFYKTLNIIIKNINNKNNRKKIYEKSSFLKKAIINIFIMITFFLITYKPILEYSSIEILFFSLVIHFISYMIIFSLSFNKKAIIEELLLIITGIMFYVGAFSITIMPSLEYEITSLIVYIFGIICIIIMGILSKLMLRRTKYGIEILGKIKGFKNFLETAEKDKLEAMIYKDPTYFYNILPYTYVLDISDEWINKFEAISLKAPDWYNSNSSFSVKKFHKFMDNTMTSARNTMSSSSSNSSGSSSSSFSGSSSGGGISGGGSGGGGGGSW